VTLSQKSVQPSNTTVTPVRQFVKNQKVKEGREVDKSAITGGRGLPGRQPSGSPRARQVVALSGGMDRGLGSDRNSIPRSISAPFLSFPQRHSPVFPGQQPQRSLSTCPTPSNPPPLTHFFHFKSPSSSLLVHSPHHISLSLTTPLSSLTTVVPPGPAFL